jgi:MSHA pilin protein MshD
MCNSRRAAGFSLIEVVIFIIVLGLAFAGLLVLYNRTSSASVDPVIRKQALAISASLIEEIELRAFTFCDPDDSNVYTATGPPAAGSVTGCTTQESIGVEGGETRYGSTRFDNVSDYNGYCMGPGLPACPDSEIVTATGASAGLTTYRTDVSVAQVSTGELQDVVASEGLLITVTTQHIPTGTTVSLQSYRVRYAPNSP